MKKTILTILILMVAGVGWCQCVGTIKEVKEGINGVLLVGTDYIFNGEAEPNTDWVTYFPDNIALLDLAEKKALFQKDIKVRCETIIYIKYSKANDYPDVEYRKTIVDEEINKIKDIVVSVNITKTEIQLANDKKIEVNADGTKTITDSISVTP